MAPEVAAGVAPTPGADSYALTLFLRAQMAFVELPAVFLRVLSGAPLDGDADAAVMQLYLVSKVQSLAAQPSEPPQRRGDPWRWRVAAVAGARLGARRGRLLLRGSRRPSLSDAQRLPDAVPDPTNPTPAIRVGQDGQWLETPNGMRHDLGTRRPLRRLLLALATARREQVGSTLSIEQLLQAGWPGENPLPEAGSNRVYVAVSTLRKLGLGESLQRWDGGYRLDPQVPCQF